MKLKGKATQKQKDLLDRFGVRYAPGLSKAGASELITKELAEIDRQSAYEYFDPDYAGSSMGVDNMDIDEEYAWSPFY